jgi:hypothetical protein
VALVLPPFDVVSCCFFIGAAFFGKAVLRPGQLVETLLTPPYNFVIANRLILVSRHFQVRLGSLHRVHFPIEQAECQD